MSLDSFTTSQITSKLFLQTRRAPNTVTQSKRPHCFTVSHHEIRRSRCLPSLSLPAAQLVLDRTTAAEHRPDSDRAAGRGLSPHSGGGRGGKIIRSDLYRAEQKKRGPSLVREVLSGPDWLYIGLAPTNVKTISPPLRRRRRPSAASPVSNDGG